MNSYHLIDGYWLNDGVRFTDRLVTSAAYEDFDDDESDIFFFDLDEEGIRELIEKGEDTGEEFVITDYRFTMYETIAESNFLEEGEVQVWYQKDWGETADPNNLEKTHVLMGSIRADDEEEVYLKMQGENWSPMGEARTLVRAKGVHHTSMMVGDIMVINGKTLVVAILGFQELVTVPTE